MTLYARFIRIAAFCGLACVLMSCGSTLSPSALAASGAPAVSLSATSLSPGWFPVGTTSQSTNLFVTNSGSATLWITSVTLTGPNPSDFALNNGCASSLAAGANCAITFTFTPTAPGTRTAYININDNAPGGTQWGTQTVTIYGTGEGPTASLSTGSLAFGSLAVGSSSAPQTLTLSNAGNESLSISTIGLAGANPGNFAQSNNCGSSLASGSSCTISVIFKPTASGTFTAALALTDNVLGSPQIVGLTGASANTSTTVSLSATSLTPGWFPVGTTSQSTNLFVTNSGSATLWISSVTLTGPNPSDFALNNGCASSLAAGANCLITFTFTPTAPGTRTAYININDNAVGSSQTVTIYGTGEGPTASLSTGSLTFGSLAPGTTSAPQTLTLSNAGNESLSISSIGLAGANSGDFAQSNNCGSSLAPGNTCTISVTFKPAAGGTFTAALALTDNVLGSLQSVGLTGTGSGASTATTVSLSATSLAFGNEATDTTSSLQTVTLTNTGSSALTITSLALTGTNAGNFTQNNNCNATLAAGGSCAIGIAFTPSVIGSAAASFQVTDNAIASPQVVTLSGTGTHDVMLTWTAVTSPSVAGYNVFRGTSPGGEGSTPLNSSPVNGTSYTDGSVSAGTTYYYVLKSVGADGVTQSAPSNEMPATVP